MLPIEGCATALAQIPLSDIAVDMMDYKVVMTQLDGVELCKLGGCAGVDKHVHAP